MFSYFSSWFLYFHLINLKMTESYIKTISLLPQIWSNARFPPLVQLFNLFFLFVPLERVFGNLERWGVAFVMMKSIYTSHYSKGGLGNFVSNSRFAHFASFFGTST